MTWLLRLGIVLGIIFFVCIMMIIVSLVIVAGAYDDREPDPEIEYDKKGRLIMKTYIAHWYDQDQIVCDDGPFEAPSKDEAMRMAYRRKNGKGPGPMLWIEEVGESK